MHDALHIRDTLAQLLDPLGLARQLLCIRDEYDHNLACHNADTCHYMTQHAAVCILIIWLNVQLLRKLLNDCDYLIIEILLNKAIVHIDNTVTALRIKASDKLTVICRKSNRYRCFIAIPPRITHAYRVMHDHASTVISTCMWVKRIIISSFTCNCFLRYIQLPDPRKAVDHMLPLPLQLRFIIEMLQLTSAALRID